MTMMLMQRADRVTKAVPFIVARAAWYEDTYVENGNFAYPFSLFRYNVSGDEQWEETYLPLYFDFWTGVEGELLLVNSSDSSVLTHGFCSLTSQTLTLVVHSLYDETREVRLNFPPAFQDGVGDASSCSRQWTTRPAERQAYAPGYTLQAPHFRCAWRIRKHLGKAAALHRAHR